MSKIIILKRIAFCTVPLWLAACVGGNNSSSSVEKSSLSSVVESASSNITVSSIGESSSETASSVAVESSIAASASSETTVSSESSNSSTVVVSSSITEMSSSLAMSSIGESSSEVMISSSEASSSSAPVVTNLLSDPSFESGILNGDYWQTNNAKLSNDSAFVTDGTTGVNMDPVVIDDNDAIRSYVETTLAEGVLESGNIYFISLDARADTDAQWNNWDVELFADGRDQRIDFRTFNQLGIAPLGTSGEWYERAVSFVAPNTVSGVETKLRITGVANGKGALDNVKMQKLDNFIANYDFEDGDVSDFLVSGDSTLTTRNVNGSTSLSFTLDEQFGYVELPLEKGIIQSGKRYAITLDFGSATVELQGQPFLVHFIDTVSGETIGSETYNYAYFASVGPKLSAAFAFDVDRDQSSDIDWGESSGVALRISDIWGIADTELLLEKLTLSDITE